MDFLATLLQTISFIPALVNRIEDLIQPPVGSREERCCLVLSADGLIDERCSRQSKDR